MDKFYQFLYCYNNYVFVYNHQISNCEIKKSKQGQAESVKNEARPFAITCPHASQCLYLGHFCVMSVKRMAGGSETIIRIVWNMCFCTRRLHFGGSR